MDNKVPEKPNVKLLFGKHLRNLRIGLDWSQERLAHECGLDRSYIGGVERGERNLSLENIVRIAQAMHLLPCKLLEFDLDEQ